MKALYREYPLGNRRHFDALYHMAHKCLKRFTVSTGVHPGTAQLQLSPGIERVK